MQGLGKPLYHGTSNAASLLIVGEEKFKAPIYLTSDKKRAEHYAKAITAWHERLARKEGDTLIADGCAVFTFTSVPDPTLLKQDDYNPTQEPNQWIYPKPIRGLRHYSIERFPLEVDDSTRLSLECFAIGMRRG